MVDDVVIRPALLTERVTLEALQRRASLRNSMDRDALLANPDAIEVPLEQIEAGDVFVAQLDGVIVGFAAVVPRKDGGAELDALFVEPHLWKRGIGRTLVDYCTDVARRRASCVLHVIGNPHAAGFYAACGFRLIGTVETRFAHLPTSRYRMRSGRAAGNGWGRHLGRRWRLADRRAGAQT